MKNYNDGFYELIHKNSLKRRRMISLLLVLSMLVSSGVLWGLRDTGITMVNEEQCGVPEHTHTDECYADVLICGLEENEEHTHTEECYERQLVCGYEEHIHDLGCYTDEDTFTEDEIMASDMSSDDEVVYDLDEETEEELLVSDIPQLQLSNEMIALAGDKPDVINTIDNIAEGIKFTLFDYGGSDASAEYRELEGQGNNYEYDGEWKPDGNGGYYQVIGAPPYKHSSYLKSGINTGRNAKDDILFFAYGTPVPKGLDGAVVEGGDRVYNYIGEDGKQYYHPDKNSYAGDYNSNPQYSGNRAVQGIVQSDLGADGYPHVVGSDNSLKYLFSPDTTVDGVDMSEYKKVYNGVKDQGVNHLLRKETSVNGVDHLIFNSNDNYAYFNKETNNFEVYKTTFDIVNDAHHKANETNYNKFDDNGNPIVYGNEDVNAGFKIGFFPFDEYDESRKDPNYDGNGYNHHFGMTMEASFVNNKFDRVNVKEPITFKYSGDDDMWVYVDKKLALDLGGIHEPAGGMIDFSNGLVWTQDNGATGDGVSLDEVRDRLTDPDEENSLYSYVLQHSPELINGYKVYDEYGNQVGEKTAADAWNELPKPISLNTSQQSNDKWIVKPITDYIPNWYNNANGTHEIKMFYLERGGCYSNLAMEMNLPTLKPLSVTKDVKYGEHLDKTYDNTDYWFQVYEWDKANETWVIPQSEHPDSPFYLEDNRFKIKAGERKKFDDLGQDRKFKVVEIGYGNNPQNNGPEVEMSSEVFNKVTVKDQNGKETELSIINGAAETEGAVLNDMNSYNFENTIREEFTDIKVKKEWSPELGENSTLKNFVVKFKVMRTDSVTGQTKQVALKKDGVKKRTFAITSGEWSKGYDITHLLSRYGDHIYTYAVEELNVPKGYKAAYGTDASGAMVITNTDARQMEINVEKKWENISYDDKEVKLRLTRKRVGYKDSTPTWVKVNIVDEAGNLIKSYSTEQYDGVDIKNYKGVYAGGAAEIRCELPEGVEVIDPDNPVKSPSTLSAKYDDGFVVLDNLALTNPDNPSVPNEVTIKVTSNTAKDAKMILHHSFTHGENGWLPNGSTVSYTSDAGAYAKKDCLAITGRTKSWGGARLNLDPALFKVNKTYTFSVYVKSPEATRFKMTFNNGLGHFEPITDPFVDAPRNGWVQLTGTIKLPAEIDPYGMYLLVETVPKGNDYDNYPCEADTFYMDEFIAIEGRDGIRVNSPDKTDEPDGTVEIIPDRTVYSIAFNDTVGDWEARGTAQLSNDHDNDNHFDYMIVSGRNDTWHGAQLNNSIMKLVKGHKYKFDAYVQGHGDSSLSKVTLSIDTIKGHENDESIAKSRYQNIGSAAVKEGNNAYKDNALSGEFEIPAYADTENMYIYFEGDSNGPFRVHNITITDVTEPYTPPAMDGYHVANGRYYSDNSLYITGLEEDSVTNPMTLLGTYENDPYFDVKEIILDKNSGWKYYWNNTTDDSNHRIEEDAQNYLYKYYIEEVSIHDKTNNQWINVTNDAQLLTGESNDTDKSYLVSYSGNGAATNDSDDPILVKNKYIWYKLPATGGRGTAGIYVLGGFLTAMGIFSGCAAGRRRRRRD
ncbi:carbohydrate binding domain-containing protein [Ruminococcus flavefaciens]|uniref:Fibro-slime domain-containing protein n=1 Tax=Ruminococcus flavefaciens TaxID=1265 RepID=A0A315Y3C1_RUMFL|nr:carbohydrate binding domain-containing protein [Ruminococcus flavefaciens]PWJ14058.1 fibro-slime domain-containing protein [Ruminococcus flavefaciens]SSA43707.1 fibro-slime domain-containing protein [Ruminococcus flavefaciens]